MILIWFFAVAELVGVDVILPVLSLNSCQLPPPLFNDVTPFNLYFSKRLRWVFFRYVTVGTGLRFSYSLLTLSEILLS